MKRIFSVIILASLLTASVLKAQNANEPFEAGKRYSVIIDNDFCGDPDGLFQLVHHVLSTSCDIKGIIGAHHNGFSFFRDLQGKDDAEKSVNKVNEALELMGLKEQLKVVPGAAEKMTDPKQPIVSEGARLIVEEALKATPEKPLYASVCVRGWSSDRHRFCLADEP